MDDGAMTAVVSLDRGEYGWLVRFMLYVEKCIVVSRKNWRD